MSREGCGGKVLFLTHCSLTTGNELQLYTQFSWLQRRWFLMISQFVGCMFKLIRGLERIKLPWCSRCVTEKQDQTNKCFWGFSLCQVFARKLFPMTLTQVCDGHMTKREPMMILCCILLQRSLCFDAVATSLPLCCYCCGSRVCWPPQAITELMIQQ